jgi:hypothetical protein
VLWQRGYPDQGLHRAYEALQLAERVAHPFSTLLAEATLCEVLLLRGDADKARGRFTIWGATARDLLLPVLAADSRVHAGWALALEGHYEAAILELREGIAESRAAGSNEALFPCLLAWACCEAGLTSDGLSALDDAFAHSGDEQHHRPEFFRLKGELLSRLGSHDPSPGDCFSRALELAVAQGAKSLELRAATSLAGLYHAQGRDDWARDVLLPVYDWFGEGRDTRDHLRAKALLDQLR